MNYFNKYNKYLSKYNLQKGGETITRNYYLHARFIKEIEDVFTSITGHIYSNNLYNPINPPNMPPHLTLCYGPSLTYDNTDPEKEKLEIKPDNIVENIESIYPGIIENFSGMKISVKLIKVNIYFRLDSYVLKIDVQSPELLQIIDYCKKSIKGYSELTESWRIEKETNKDFFKTKYPELYEEGDDNPLHITLALFKPDTTEPQLKEIIGICDNFLEQIKDKDNIIIDRLDIKTPITKTLIDIVQLNKDS